MVLASQKIELKALIYQRFNLDLLAQPSSNVVGPQAPTPTSLPSPSKANMSKLGLTLPLLQISIVLYASNTSFLVYQARWTLTRKKRKTYKAKYKATQAKCNSPKHSQVVLLHAILQEKEAPEAPGDTWRWQTLQWSTLICPAQLWGETRGRSNPCSR